MPISSLDHVQLTMPAGGRADAIRFYSRLLGMAVVEAPGELGKGGGVWFRAGRAELHLSVEEEFRAARKGHPALIVNDLDDLAASCEAAGFVPIWDDRYPGVRRFYLRDPFGNRLEIMQPIPAETLHAEPQ